MAILGGSPLGLVGLKSLNANFDNYNARKRNSGSGNISLFSGDRILRPFKVGIGGTDTQADEPYNTSSKLHSDELYNTTISNIVEKLKDTKAALSYMDFAYLKDVGVYPNNRLMIARRFATPQFDNIMYTTTDPSDLPLVTLISWKPTNEDFLSISFGELWTEADASFKSILNDLGDDFKISKLGEYLDQGSNVVPYPGLTETLQRKFLIELGILKADKFQENQIPEGNPNLIKEAKQRKLVAAGKAGSGLKCSVSIKMTCTWEQKFIEGIDPTLAWMDIIAMVTRFGTSTSQTYGLSLKFSENIKDILKDPETLVKKTIEALKKTLTEQIEKIKNALKEKDGDSEEEKEEKKEMSEEEQESGLLDKVLGELDKITDSVLNTIVQKYKERVIGVINALSGLPSTPWHVTLGNPLRPVFCSGDMYMSDNVTLKLGKNLSFNDLPTEITADFTLVNARPWGLQEILAKFNSGYLRVLSYKQDAKGLLNNQSSDFSLDDDKGVSINGDRVDLKLTSKPPIDVETRQEFNVSSIDTEEDVVTVPATPVTTPVQVTQPATTPEEVEVDIEVPLDIQPDEDRYEELVSDPNSEIPVMAEYNPYYSDNYEIPIDATYEFNYIYYQSTVFDLIPPTKLTFEIKIKIVPNVNPSSVIVTYKGKPIFNSLEKGVNPRTEDDARKWAGEQIIDKMNRNIIDAIYIDETSTKNQYTA